MTRAGLSEADIVAGKARAQEKVTRRMKLLRGDGRSRIFRNAARFW